MRASRLILIGCLHLANLSGSFRPLEFNPILPANQTSSLLEQTAQLFSMVRSLKLGDAADLLRAISTQLLDVIGSIYLIKSCLRPSTQDGLIHLEDLIYLADLIDGLALEFDQSPIVDSEEVWFIRQLFRQVHLRLNELIA